MAKEISGKTNINIKRPLGVTAIALLVGVIGLSILQIVSADSSTKTELALYNILQFILAVGCSWITSQYYSEQGFNESQKKFAIAAFRRIKEIERCISRSQSLLSNETGAIQAADQHNHQAVMVSLMGAQDAVNSSVADWGDIIGDEIHITNEIARLKKMRASADRFEKDYMDNLKMTYRTDSDVDSEIEDLLSELPASLRLDQDSSEKLSSWAKSEIHAEFDRTGAITLSGFWDPEDTFNRDLSGVSSGETFYLARGYTKFRTDSLLLYDKDGNTCGVITNKFLQIDNEKGIDYGTFVSFLENSLQCKFTPRRYGGAPIPVTIKMIDSEEDVQRFEVSLTKDNIPPHPLANSSD